MESGEVRTDHHVGRLPSPKSTAFCFGLGSNGDATLAMDGQEAVWTNVSHVAQGERIVAVLRFIPQDEGATCRFAWKDPKTGEEMELTVRKR